MTDLVGRTVVVTGAARGLGTAIAERIARDGARVWVADINHESGQAVAAALRDQGCCADFVHVDVGDPESVAAMAEVVLGEGPVYGLVNNAALADSVGGKAFQEIEPAEWDAIMRVNARGPWLVARAFADVMIYEGTGRIVNLASDAALYGSPRLAHYISSKGAVIALTRAMARELGAHDITVNCLAPGLTVTESTTRVPTERHQLYERNRAIPRPQTPTDVAGAATFLLGPESAYMTGQLLVIDGGFVFH